MADLDANAHRTMAAAALRAMQNVLDLAPADRVLVVTDAATAACGAAFATAAREHGCTVCVFTLPDAGRPLAALPPGLPSLLENADVVVNAIVGDPAEVPFRLQWIGLIEGSGRHRLGHSPGITADMMLGGALDVDYAAMHDTALQLAHGLRKAATVRLTTPTGTDLVMDVRDRGFTHDLKARPTAGANLPCGEVYAAPVETGANGLLVVDGGFAGHGRLASPVVITVRHGRCVDLDGDDADLLAAVSGFMDTDEGARNIAELGIGLNPRARLGSHILESEKTLGTVHVAFGDNDGIAGGQGRSRMHMDYLVLAPTLEVTTRGGTRRVLMRDGQLVPVRST
ncbi:MAG: aminopeptidase [bacterium]|nr:aminopeptidase [bacterium]